MHILYEEGSELKVGTILSETSGVLQVQAPQGKRTKIRSDAVLLRYSEPAPARLWQQAQEQAAAIDLPLLWSACVPDQDVDLETLTEIYLGVGASPVGRAALLLCIQTAPVYFYRRGKGRFHAASTANLQAALLGQQRRREQEAQRDAAVVSISRGVLPEWMRLALPQLAYAPDKNSLAWKTVMAAAQELNLTIPELWVRCGVVRDSCAWHVGQFCYHQVAPWPADQPLPRLSESFDALAKVAVDAFSIDDATTTEIDDAFSVSSVDEEHWKIGIHIAAPALGLMPGSALDLELQDRMSTVYMPGAKITMLPQSLIDAYSLNEGCSVPSLTLWLAVRKSDYTIVTRETELVQIRVAHNLRLPQLERLFIPEPADLTAIGAQEMALYVLWRLACRLATERGAPGRPGPSHIEYGFKVDEQERVTIVPRPRGAPIDTLVAELMIEANRHWGELLVQGQYPGLFRTQADGKTRLMVEPGPHQGLGLIQYAWCTSPLRRYVDLINQWQLVSLVQKRPARIPEPEKLRELARRFELVYDSYNDFQRQMERYWCLRWLQQEKLRKTSAVAIREGLVRLSGLPLVLKTSGTSSYAPGAEVEVMLGEPDLWGLTVTCSIA